MTNARDVIAAATNEPPHFAAHQAKITLAALMAAAGVEPGGDLVIHHGDGWPLRRLEPFRDRGDTLYVDRGSHRPNYRGGRFGPKPNDELVYRVVAP